VTLLAHLRRARDHIDRNYCEPLDLDGLARVACYHAETAGHPFGDSSASSPALQKGGTGVEAVTRDNTGNWWCWSSRENSPQRTSSRSGHA
jgi:hypothetical protein